MLIYLLKLYIIHSITIDKGPNVDFYSMHDLEELFALLKEKKEGRLEDSKSSDKVSLEAISSSSSFSFSIDLPDSYLSNDPKYLSPII